MFEVIISKVRSGKVKRKQFGTREEAENYVSYREQSYLYNPKVKHWIRRSLRDLRVEINFRAELAPRVLTMSAATALPVAA
jgi:hypothetical protein